MLDATDRWDLADKSLSVGTPSLVPVPVPAYENRITCTPRTAARRRRNRARLELARRGHEIHSLYASPFRLRGSDRVTFHESRSSKPLFEQSVPDALALAVKQHEVAKREHLDLMHVHYAIPHAATAGWRSRCSCNEQLDL